LIAPHGGTLVESYLSQDEQQELLERLPGLPKIILDEIELSDLLLIANGAFSPLAGFNTRSDYERIISDNRLDSGLVWTIPIVLSFAREERGRFRPGETIALMTSERKLAGILELEEVFLRDKSREAQAVFGTGDLKHPGVNYLMSKGDVLLGGKIKAVSVRASENADEEFSPRQTRAAFAERGWRSIVAFQTRNPIHRAHEYLQKVALEMVDGLFIHPLVGFTKPGDIPAGVRLRCYRKLLEDYYPKERVLLGTFPAAMRYAGPKEAVFHALVRKNYGCTHFIVGRDHAGVGEYYGTYDAQNIFNQFSQSELDIQILKFENTFFCKRCGNLASTKTCPHSELDRVFLSGTIVREMLSLGQTLPEEFTRPEVAEILTDYYQESLTFV
jgi:sulfate adenylyltransferase